MQKPTFRQLKRIQIKRRFKETFYDPFCFPSCLIRLVFTSFSLHNYCSQQTFRVSTFWTSSCIPLRFLFFVKRLKYLSNGNSLAWDWNENLLSMGSAESQRLRHFLKNAFASIKWVLIIVEPLRNVLRKISADFVKKSDHPVRRRRFGAENFLLFP